MIEEVLLKEFLFTCDPKLLNIEIQKQNLLRTCDPKYKFIRKTGPDESTLQVLSGEQSQNRQNSTDLHGEKNAPWCVY